MAGCLSSGVSLMSAGRGVGCAAPAVPSAHVEEAVAARKNEGGNCMLQGSSARGEKRAGRKMMRFGRISQPQACSLGYLYEDFGREELSGRKKVTGSMSRGVRSTVCLLPGMGGGFWEGAESDSSASERFQSRKGPSRKARDRSVLLSLIQEIEPLDVSHISKDASVNSMDAMKRTISGMLGILPSDQFHVSVEMEREPLARLLVSAMMTGYTLRNAEYRMCLQRSLDLSSDSAEGCPLWQADDLPPSTRDAEGNEAATSSLESGTRNDVYLPFPERTSCRSDNDGIVPLVFDVPRGLGELSPEALAYIQQLQSQMAAASQELEDCKRTLAELEVDNVVTDDQNEVLDYLRSLDPDKVAELSQPTSTEVEEVIQQVINGLLGSLSPAVRGSSSLGQSGGSSNTSASSMASVWDHETDTELAGNVPLQFQATVTASRDYLARLLFWCMLLGHHMRALEYRLELSRTFSLNADARL